jgi:diguanylate cyclase (GGDEF)-like protein
MISKLFSFDSLATRLLRRIFFVYFSITILMTIGHVYSEYHITKNAVKEELREIEGTFTPALRTALWSVNEKQLASIADGILKLPVITGLKIESGKGESLISEELNGDLSSSGSFEYNYEVLQKALNDQYVYLAKVTFLSDSQVVFDRVKFGFLFILINAFLKSLILWFLFLWVFKTMLNKPLTKFVTGLQGMDFEGLDKHRINLDLEYQDELKLLENSYNQMLDKLYEQKKSFVDAQQNHQLELERKVTERTHELELANQQLNFYASTDPLTSIYNRRKFFTLADKYRAIALRNKHPLTLLALDLDHFKQINDEFGHAAGDEVLVEFTREVGLHLRESDVFARFGGEEFAVLLENTPIEDAVKVADHILETARALKFDFNGRSVSITVSIGIAELDGQDEDIGALIARSDKALYHAKEDGRNQKYIFDSDT